jgi:hypothetical protein
MLSRNILFSFVAATSTSLATSMQLIEDPLSITPISHQSALFSAIELHDMGDLGKQEIEYVVNCQNQTMALTGFAVITPSGRATSNDTNANSNSISFYKPTYEHDVRILHQACVEASERKAMK